MIANHQNKSRWRVDNQKSRKTILRRIFNPAWFYLLKRPLRPLSRKYGMERGRPIDRYYIDKFLEESSLDIKGVCLEIRDNRYTSRYAENIEKADILDIDRSNPQATVYGDLRSLSNIPDNSYDCIILTQVLQYIDNLDAAISECHRVLKPNGVILATVPAMSRIDPHTGQQNEFWRFTEGGLKYIFSKFFKPKNITAESCGNVLSGLGFWTGMATEEFTEKELEYNDPLFPVIVTVKARK